MMSAIRTVFGKEVRENLRDRRTVLTSLLYGPMFGPALMALMFGVIFSQMRDRSEQPLELAVVGAEHAPNLVAHLERNGVKLKAPPADPEAAIRAQDEEVILRIDPGYAEAWNQGRPARVDLLFDRSRSQAQTSVQRARRVLEQYASVITTLRLQLRGIDPQLTRPVLIADQDLSTPVSRGAQVLAMIPYLMMFTLFLGGMYLAIDTTAGERERQSLEPLLINPVPRASLVVGKVSATVLFTLVSLAISLTAIGVCFRMLPMDELGLNVRLPPSTLMLIFALLVPVGVLAAAAQSLLACYSRSFREAQTWLSVLMLVPALPSLILAINPVKPTLTYFLTPLVGQSVMIIELLRGDRVPLLQAVLLSLLTLLLAAVCIFATVRLFQRERLVLGGG